MILTLLLTGASSSMKICDNLAYEYEKASKRIALSTAEGLGDGSAIRRMARETATAGILNEAAQTLDLMVAHKCELPTESPKGGLYIIPAMECQSARLRQQKGDYSTPEACDMSKWEKIKGVKTDEK